MKRILKAAGYVVLSIAVVIYIGFLFVLPHLVDVGKYKPQIQTIVKDNLGLALDFGKAKIYTTPLFEAGIKINNISLKLPDGSTVFETPKIKGKIFLPSLLWRSVRIVGTQVESPKLNAEILNSEQFKVIRAYEDVVNNRRRDMLNHPEKYQTPENSSVFDFSKIKITVPSLKLNNYALVVDDVKAGHKLTLKGEELKLGYFNSKIAKLKTNAKILSDSDENISANLDLDVELPEFTPKEEEHEDLESVYSIPFINPVKTYRDYNLKSNIDSKLKIRRDKKSAFPKVYGYLDITDTTVSLSGLQLPKSYFKLKGKGQFVDVDTNLYVTSDSKISLAGELGYGKNPYIDLNINSDRIYLSDLLNITRAYLSTIHIRNDIDKMSASGYINANANLKTDFENIESCGNIVVRKGNISDSNIGLIFNDINANIILDDNVIKIADTHTLINGEKLSLSGRIDSNSLADFDVKGTRIPIMALYKAFAPREIKNKYNLSSGFLTINSKIKGSIKNLTASLVSDIESLRLNDYENNFVLSNGKLHLGLAAANGILRGRLYNKDFGLQLPKFKSVIRDNDIVVDVTNDDINMHSSAFMFNDNSALIVEGSIKDYLTKKPDIKFNLFGNLATTDLSTVIGNEVAPYFKKQGKIPVNAQLKLLGKKIKTTVQLMADSGNYITPVDMVDLIGKQTIFQLKADLIHDGIRVYRTGIYTRPSGSDFGSDIVKNMSSAHPIVNIKGLISNLSIKPFINLIKLSMPDRMDGAICLFPSSKFSLSGGAFLFGNLDFPTIKGNFNISDISIPELITKVRNIKVDFDSQNFVVNIDDSDLNGSDINVEARTSWNLLPSLTMRDVRVNSKYIDVEKVLAVSNALISALPKPAVHKVHAVKKNNEKEFAINKALKAAKTIANSIPSVDYIKVSKENHIPLAILDGNIRLRKIVLDKIYVDDTTGKISLKNDVLYVNKLKTHPMDGDVSGDVSANLVTMLIKAKVSGKSFDIDHLLREIMGMRDTLSGDMNFIADISLQGSELEQQMKTLKGYIDFNIKEGQLGPFGKFENFIMAENIRENAFFSSAIGSIITNIVTFDTSRYNSLYGHLSFNGGVANISPIVSQGNVMALYIAGNLNLLDNTAEMKVRGKLASAFSDSLGPLANVNPINLVKHTPGLNIVLAKTFMVFCEAVSQEEMDAIPGLGEGKSDENATKFQIRLKGDTRKPLKMIKSFKWLALNSDIEAANDFVSTLPIPEGDEENMSVEQLIELRQQQAQQAIEDKKPVNRVKNYFKKAGFVK